MTPLLFTLLRLGFLVLLWLFVIFLVMVLRRDVHGTQVRDRRPRSVAPAPAPVHSVSAPVRTSAPHQPMLAVTGGPLTGITLPLGSAAIVIGRSPDSALVLDDSFSSSRHARIFPDQGSWWVEDLDSTNGTFVEGHKIATPTRIHAGERIVIGKTTVELR